MCTHCFCLLTAGAPVARISANGLNLWLKDQLKPGSPKLFSKMNVIGELIHIRLCGFSLRVRGLLSSHRG